MALYVIESPHTVEECAVAGETFGNHPRAKEILDSTYWGCESGDHTSWTIGDFASESEIRDTIPEPLKSKLRIVPVGVYSYDEMMQSHQG